MLRWFHQRTLNCNASINLKHYLTCASNNLYHTVQYITNHFILCYMIGVQGFFTRRVLLITLYLLHQLHIPLKVSKSICKFLCIILYYNIYTVQFMYIQENILYLIAVYMRSLCAMMKENKDINKFNPWFFQSSYVISYQRMVPFRWDNNVKWYTAALAYTCTLCFK